MLPSKWTSDLLTAGDQCFKVDKSTTKDAPQTKASTSPPIIEHDEALARLGRCPHCIPPNMLSLHEMAALRKKYREEAKAKAMAASM